MSRNVQERESIMRLLKAVAVVLAILLVVPGIDVIAQRLPMTKASAPFQGIDARVLIGAGDAHAVSERIEAVAQSEQNQPSEVFLDEIGLLRGARDVHVFDDGLVVGYVIDAEEERVCALLDAHMAQRAWHAVPLGDVCGTSFLKNDGMYRWCLVTCTKVGTSTSVVVRSVREPDEKG